MNQTMLQDVVLDQGQGGVLNISVVLLMSNITPNLFNSLCFQGKLEPLHALEKLYIQCMKASPESSRSPNRAY